MSNQRRPGCVRPTSPDEQPKPKAKAKARAKTNGKDEAQKKEKDVHDCESEAKLKGTPSLKRGQSKKQKDISSGDSTSLDNSEKSEEKHGEVFRPGSVNKETGENDRQDSAKNKLKSKRKTGPLDCESEGKTQHTTNGKSCEKTAPKRPSKKQKDHPNLDKEATPESSESKSEKKAIASSTRNESTPKKGFPDAKNARDASPAVSARSPDRKLKSAQKTEDALEEVLKTTIDKLRIKKSERSKASRCVNAITEKVIAHLKQDTTWCPDIERLRTGSYYENLKVSDTT